MSDVIIMLFVIIAILAMVIFWFRAYEQRMGEVRWRRQYGEIPDGFCLAYNTKTLMCHLEPIGNKNISFREYHKLSPVMQTQVTLKQGNRPRY